MNYTEKYELWLNSDVIDENTKKELRNLNDNKEIEDRFYKDLEFGTGGLRGVIGAGTNRMNIYTVSKATQGLASYLLENYKKDINVSIAYDSRIKSTDFAKTAACVLCANGIKVNLFESLRPTPMLSYTVRYLKSKAGIVITASHNPKIYNGYKVYGEDGGQVTDKAAGEIYNSIEKLKSLNDVKKMGFEEAKNKGLLTIIGENVDKTYIEKVKGLMIRSELVKKNAGDLKIIYTPLHGTGNIPVRRVLKELGYKNVFVVKEQELPDGNFPTVSYPNPEQPAVFKIALEMAKEIKPDVIFGTDPDCDRIGAVVKDSAGEYKVLTGNQTGTLLMNYVITSLKETGKMPENPAVVKTIVTTEIARRIAEANDVKLIDVLTGFKYIGEKIKEFESTKKNSFIFGFEESYGCLSGTFVRDKDAVIASMLICEMVLYYKSRNMTLYDGLMELYKKYGYYKQDLVSIELKGKSGAEKISKAIETLRNENIASVSGVKVVKFMDYELQKEKDFVKHSESDIDLPKSNVLKYILEDDSWFVVRPSGTEPKIKIYVSVVGKDLKDSEAKIEKFKNDVMEIVKKPL